jgi:glycosyltransferase involved in cell wall biosynthesis
VVADVTAQHVRSGSGGRAHKSIQRHIIKNRLLVLYRNEDRWSLLRDLPWIVGQLLARLAFASVTAPSALLGVADFAAAMPAQRAARRAIRQGRRASAAEIRAWFGKETDGGFRTRTWATAPSLVPPATRVPRLLVVCGEPVGERMAGPAIRSMELARAVAAAGCEVTMAAPRGAGQAPLGPGIRLVPLTRPSLNIELAHHDCVLVWASLLTRFPALLKATIPLAVDLYVPVPLEAAEIFRDRGAAVRRATLAEADATLGLELERADTVFCASDRQRELYAGLAGAAGRRDLDALFRVVPFGVPDEPPPPRSGRLRAAVPGAQPGDPLVLWGGGLHDWFEPELVVDAVADLAAADIPGIRLVFLGADPPNVALVRHGAAARAAAVAVARGVLDINVFFLPGWVPYRERGQFFADADLGVSAHRAGPETTYSWRTRLLDYAWAGLPVAATSGDALSARLAEAGAAQLAPPGDRVAMAGAIRALLTDPGRGARASEAALSVARELRWSKVAAPLVAWVRDPVATHAAVSPARARRALWWMYAHKAIEAMRSEGPQGLARRAGRFRDRRA